MWRTYCNLESCNLSIYLLLPLSFCFWIHLSPFTDPAVTPCAALSIGGLLTYVLTVDTEIIGNLRHFIVRGLKIIKFSLAEEMWCNTYHIKDKGIV